MEKRRMDWFAMRLSAEERAQLAALAAREGVSLSVAARRAIQEALSSGKRAPAKHAAGVFAAPGP